MNRTKVSLLLVFLMVFFSFCGMGTQRVKNKQYTKNAHPPVLKNIAVLPEIPDDSLAIHFLQPYSDLLKNELSTFIATIDSPFYNTFGTGNLGRLSADYMLQSATKFSQSTLGIPCHFAIGNNGGIRGNLFPGEITMKDIYEVMPFENELVIVRLGGIYVDSLIQYIAQLQGSPVAGLLVQFKKGNTQKENTPVSVMVNAGIVSTESPEPLRYLPFDPSRDYLIATNSYMVLGGDGFTMFTHAKALYYPKLLLRDVVATGLKNEYEHNKTIAHRTQLRINSLDH
ncbi:MAG: hypothetical protein CK532_07935 [Flavobacteriales bacterium]|nr:hypothetical protein [Flavobacteriaceae bacterium]PHX91503.1 MAG: hypothetical protein CK532_07935 [Flavobacteriales bacterium]